MSNKKFLIAVIILTILAIALLVAGIAYAKPSKPQYGNAYFWYSTPSCEANSLHVTWFDAPPELNESNTRVYLHTWFAFPRGNDSWLQLYTHHQTMTLNFSHIDHSGNAHYYSYEFQHYPVGDDDPVAAWDEVYGEYNSTAMVVYETSYIEWDGGTNVHLANPYDSSITRSFYVYCTASTNLPYAGKDGDYPMGASQTKMILDDVEVYPYPPPDYDVWEASSITIDPYPPPE